MAFRQRNARGHFVPLHGEESKRRYNLTLTPTAWEALGRLAEAQGLSRSELVESYSRKADASERRYTQILDAVQEAVFCVGPDAEVSFANASARGLLASGCGLVEHPHNAEVFDTGVCLAADLEVGPVDNPRCYHVDRRPVFDGAGKIVEVVTVARDVSDEVRLERALNRRVSELGLLFDVIPIPLALAEDAACSRIHGNAALLRVLEAAPDSNFSFTAPGVRPPVTMRRHGRTLEKHELPMQRAIASGSRVENEELELVRVDGRVLHVIHYAAPLRDEHGHCRGAVAAMLDITEQKRTQDALRASEERLRLAVEAAQAGTWDWDIVAGRVYWSPDYCRLYGIDPQTVQPSYETWLACVHPDDRAEADGLARRAVAECTNFEAEFRILHPQGERWVRAVGRTERGASGLPVRMVGIALDITETKQAQQERERLLQRERSARAEAEVANRTKDEFLAILSHELRTPLNPIIGWTQLLRLGKLTPTKQATALEVIERNAKLQNQLIADLLDVSRIQQGKFHCEMRPIDLLPVIEAATEAVHSLAAAAAVDLCLHLPQSRVQVCADPTRLQQVVWNLLTNAVKFTPAGGRVKAALVLRDGRAVLTVQDTGVGIAPEFLPHLWERFRQADSTTTRARGGLGLGLFIVRHIVELHGGRVSVESEGVGRGAMFVVELPVEH